MNKTKGIIEQVASCENREQANKLIAKAEKWKYISDKTLRRAKRKAQNLSK